MSPDRPDQSADSAADDVTYERFVFWHLGEYRFAVPVEDVKAITEKPDDVTTVPRSPVAVDGVTDLRGEITAIIDPRTYVPDAGAPAADPALLVLDRPTDEQAAAIAVDDVHGVETIPVDDVFTVDDFDADEVEGSALEHPLLVGLVRQTWRDEASVREEIVAQVERRAADEFETPFDDQAFATDLGGGAAGRAGADASDDGVEVGEFTLDEDDALDETDPLDPGELEDLGIGGLEDDDEAPFGGTDEGVEFAAAGDAPSEASAGTGAVDDSGVADAAEAPEDVEAVDGSGVAGAADGDDVEVDVTAVVSIDRLLRAIEGERDRLQTAR